MPGQYKDIQRHLSYIKSVRESGKPNAENEARKLETQLVTSYPRSNSQAIRALRGLIKERHKQALQEIASLEPLTTDNRQSYANKLTEIFAKYGVVNTFKKRGRTKVSTLPPALQPHVEQLTHLQQTLEAEKQAEIERQQAEAQAALARQEALARVPFSPSLETQCSIGLYLIGMVIDIKVARKLLASPEFSAHATDILQYAFGIFSNGIQMEKWSQEMITIVTYSPNTTTLLGKLIDQGCARLPHQFRDTARFMRQDTTGKSDNAKYRQIWLNFQGHLTNDGGTMNRLINILMPLARTLDQWQATCDDMRQGKATILGMQSPAPLSSDVGQLAALLQQHGLADTLSSSHRKFLSFVVQTASLPSDKEKQQAQQAYVKLQQAAGSENIPAAFRNAYETNGNSWENGLNALLQPYLTIRRQHKSPEAIIAELSELKANAEGGQVDLIKLLNHMLTTAAEVDKAMGLAPNNDWMIPEWRTDAVLAAHGGANAEMQTPESAAASSSSGSASSSSPSASTTFNR